VVKKITHEQSRRNSARRRRKVAAQHRQAGHWGERSEPMLTSQKVSLRYPRFHGAVVYLAPAGSRVLFVESA
jgi:hypothetical protein